jgi:hypothetical protein
MRSRIRTALSIVLISFNWTVAWSCTCEEANIESLEKSSAQVMFAHVTSAALRKKKIEITLESIHYVKGRGVRSLWTHADSSMCGLQVSVGRDYLFYVSKDAQVQKCSSKIMKDVPVDAFKRYYQHILEWQRTKDL